MAQSLSLLIVPQHKCLNRSLRLSVLFLLSCFLGVGMAFGQSSRFDRVIELYEGNRCQEGLDLLLETRPQKRDTLYLMTKYQGLWCLGRYKEAYREVKKVMRLTQGSMASVWIHKGEIEEALGNSKQAHKTYSEGVVRFPDLSGLWYNLGKMEESAGNAAGAEKCFQRYFELMPTFTFVLRNLAYAQIAQQKSAAALATLAIAESRLPKENWPLMMAGDIFYSLGEYKEASRKYTAITESDPQNVEAWIARGEAAYKVPVPQAAEESFERALALSDAYPRAWMGRAKLRISYRQFDFAVGDLERVIQLDSASQEAYLLMGRCYFELAQYSQAVIAFDLGIAQNKNDADAWLYRGDALEKMGKMDEAISSWRKAAKLGSDKAAMRIQFHTEEPRGFGFAD